MREGRETSFGFQRATDSQLLDQRGRQPGGIPSVDHNISEVGVFKGNLSTLSAYPLFKPHLQLMIVGSIAVVNY